MPQMFPMSWVFIYLYVLMGFILVTLVVSYSDYLGLFSGGEEDSSLGEISVSEEIWQW